VNLASPISSGCDGVRLGCTGNNVNQGPARSARSGLQSDSDVPLMKPTFRSLSAHVHGGLSVALVGLILSPVSGEAHAVWSYDAPRAAGTIQIDGRLDDAWSGAPGPVAVPGQARAVPPRAGDSRRVNFSRVEWPLIEADDGYRKEREPVEW
jgi:hypothetical protein